ncbi:MAG TPA: SMI1/KNR4 family protein [Bacillota bacterium]|jgi:hypothetical protein|nr:SMI1/KNR4 family protein [Bacillota bacterium]HPO97983.1 SMI1/KNR4 family protein [Bacillota bacterium]
MRSDLFGRINDLRDQFPESFGRPATEKEILEAENRLGVKFHADYRFFLKEFGSVF